MNEALFSDVPIDKVDPDLFSEEAAPDFSELESFARGAANNVPLIPQAIAGGSALLGDEGYSENLADWNTKAAQAKSANPVSYGAGAVTGTVAPMFIPGVGAAMKAAPIMTNAGLGAASAISNIDLVKDPAKAAKEAAIGGTIGAGVGKIAKMLPGPDEALSKLVSEEAVAAKMAHPSMESVDIETMARALPNTFGKMKRVSSGVSEYADSLLSSSPYLEEGAVSKDIIKDAVKRARESFTGMSDEGSGAIKTLDQWAERANKLHNTISQQNLKGFIKNIDKDINWDRIRYNSGTYQPSLEEQGLMKLRGTLDDLLKEANPQYGEQMAIVSDALDTSRNFVRNFGLRKEAGELLPSDRTSGILDKALLSSKAEKERVFGGVQEFTGEDLRLPLLLRQFKGPTPESPAGIPAKAVAGMAGAALGQGLGLGGMGLGAVVGARELKTPVSMAGRRGAEWVIENVMTNPSLRQYLPSLSAAAQRGSDSLIANHYILMQNDPDYNKAFTEGMNGQQAQ
jgi:hypothetical protein